MKTIFAAILLLISLSALSNEITLNVKLSPAGSFQAVSNKAKGNIIKQGDSFTADKISVNIDSFKTGIELRDTHTWKHLNYTKYPKAILTEVKGQGGNATGNLEVNGKKLPVSMTYTVDGQNVNAKFSVEASKFNLPKAEYLMVSVNDLIEVEAKLPFKEQKN